MRWSVVETLPVSVQCMNAKLRLFLGIADSFLSNDDVQSLQIILTVPRLFLRL